MIEGNVLEKTRMQFVIEYPTNKTLSQGGGSKEALGNWNLRSPVFTVIWKTHKTSYVRVHKTKIAKEDEIVK